MQYDYQAEHSVVSETVFQFVLFDQRANDPDYHQLRKTAQDKATNAYADGIARQEWVSATLRSFGYAPMGAQS